MFGVKRLNISIMGLMGHGKSSFINSLMSTFKGKFTVAAHTASSSSTVTTQFQRINLFDIGFNDYLNIIDTFGIRFTKRETDPPPKDTSFESSNYRWVLKDYLDGRFQGYKYQEWDQVDKSQLNTAQQDKLINQEVHSIALVVSALSTKQELETIREFLKILQGNTEIKRPVQIVLTFCDKFIRSIEGGDQFGNYNVKKIYENNKLYERSKEIAAELDVDDTQIQYMVNYTKDLGTEGRDFAREYLLLQILQSLKETGQMYIVNRLQESICILSELIKDKTSDEFVQNDIKTISFNNKNDPVESIMNEITNQLKGPLQDFELVEITQKLGREYHHGVRLDTIRGSDPSYYLLNRFLNQQERVSRIFIRKRLSVLPPPPPPAPQPTQPVVMKPKLNIYQQSQLIGSIDLKMRDLELPVNLDSKEISYLDQNNSVVKGEDVNLFEILKHSPQKSYFIDVQQQMFSNTTPLQVLVVQIGQDKQEQIIGQIEIPSRDILMEEVHKIIDQYQYCSSNFRMCAKNSNRALNDLNYKRSASNYMTSVEGIEKIYVCDQN